MSTATVEAGWSWQSLLQAWAETDVPTGWRAEITEGGITVTPPLSPAHNLIAAVVDEALRPGLPAGASVFQTLGVRIEPAGRLYIPDLVVMPRDVLAVEDSSVPAEHALLVVEITSKENADQDRRAKRWAYARGGVALYLLIDRWADDGPAVTLFSDPHDGHYRRNVQVSFGENVTVPAPFNVDIDTADFPVPLR